MSDHFPRALRELHQPFVHGLAARLAAAIRTPTDVRLTNVSSRTLWGLIEKLPDPTCLAVIASARFAEQALLEFSPAILFPLIDRLLGGGNHPSSISQRPLTEIEQRLALHLAGMVLAELRPIWSPEAAAELTVERIETNPHRLSECLPASEPIWQMEFTVAIEQARGGLRICLPASLAAQLCPLDAAGAATSAARPTGAAGNPLVQLVAHLAETTLTDRDLAELRPGDLITTDHTVESPLIIRVDGVPQFQARPGAMQGRKAVRIEDLLEPPG